MKKSLYVLLTCIILAFTLGIFASATETETPDTTDGCLLGDVDFDGKITSADARLILRYSVSLEDLSDLAIAYSNIDMDETVSSADARLALRTSVNLESKNTHDYEITAYNAASCTLEGSLKAKCKDCAAEISMVTNKTGHTLEKEAPCDTVAICSVCATKVNVAAEHNYSSSGLCTFCGAVSKAQAFEALKEVVRSNGTNQENVLVYGEDLGEYYVALCYFAQDDYMYLYTGFGVISEDEYGVEHYGEYYNYLDLEKTFTSYESSMALVVDGITSIYIEGYIDSTKANHDAPGSFTLTHYEALEGIPDTSADVSYISEGMSLDAIDWLIDICKKHDIPLTADLLGFVNF